MKRGKWYLAYTYRDTFGGGLGGTIEHEETPLEATTEEAATSEAESIWEKKVVEAIAYWEIQKKTWVSPPASPFEDGPWDPCIVYKIRN